MSDIATCGRCGKKYADRHLCTAPLSDQCTMCQKQPALICHRCFQNVAAERDNANLTLVTIEDIVAEGTDSNTKRRIQYVMEKHRIEVNNERL